MTGVFLPASSVLLQPASNKTRSRINRNCQLPIADCRFDLSFNWQSAFGNRQSFLVIFDGGKAFILFLRERLTRHAILAFNPPAEIDQLAPLRTEWTKGIIFPLDWLTAGWAFHESCSHSNGRVS